MPQPPLLPAETLLRVLRLAKFDGLSVTVLGSVFALLAAARGDTPFAVIGLLAAGAGAIELHGAHVLRQGEPRGMRWLTASQPLLYLVVLGYCGLRLMHFEMPPIPERFAETFELSARQAGMSVEQYLQTLNRISAMLVAIASTCYQGGMTIYYLRRRQAVETALTFETA